MALETLKNVTEIGGYKILNMHDAKEMFPDMFIDGDRMDWDLFEKYVRPNYYIYYRPDVGSITFKIQSRPIKEVKIERMLPDFMYYLKLQNTPEGEEPKEWNTDAMKEHALKCVEENSKDWIDFQEMYGNDYSGVNGCQVDTLIHTARMIIDKFNESIPCEENDNAIMHLDKALDFIHDRKVNREKRGVEGTMNA